MAGNYTCAAVKFYLERTYGYYLAQVYLPSILVVILSWVSFWLDIDAVPARISLGLLTGMYCLDVGGGVLPARISLGLLTGMYCLAVGGGVLPARISLGQVVFFWPGFHWDC